MELNKLFSNIYGDLKDITNYVMSSGGKKYILSRTLTVKQNTPLKYYYWNWYKNAFNKDQPAGSMYLPKKIENVGKGTARAKNGVTLTYVDFIYNGKKAVILVNPRYLKLTEKKTIYKSNVEKEKAVLKLKETTDETVHYLQNLALLIIKFAKKKNTLNEAQKKVLTISIRKYNTGVSLLKKVEGISLSTSKYDTNKAISGLGIAPVVIGLVAVGVIVLGVITYFTLDKILNTISAVKKTGYETKLQTIALETLQNNLKNPNLTKEEKQQLVDKTYKVVEDAESQKTLISKQEEKANESIFDTIKTIAYIALAGGGLFVGYKLISKSDK